MKQQVLSIMQSKTLQVISQLSLGCIFIIAGTPKIIHPSDFAKVISNYRILPEFLIPTAAILIPIIEVLFGILLALNIVPRTSAAVLSLLLIVFIIAILITIIKGISIECGCFIELLEKSGKSVSSSWIYIFRDLLFLVPGVIIISNRGHEEHLK